jgi:hypothetical protein
MSQTKEKEHKHIWIRDEEIDNIYWCEICKELFDEAEILEENE